MSCILMFGIRTPTVNTRLVFIQNPLVGFCLRSNLTKTEIMFLYLVRFDDHASFVFLLERVR